MRLISSYDTAAEPTLITPWTLMHFLWGVWATIIVKYFKFSDTTSFVIVNIIHIIYEMNDYYTTYHNGKPMGEHVNNNSLVNSITDQIAAVAGCLLVLRYYRPSIDDYIIPIAIWWPLQYKLFYAVGIDGSIPKYI